MITRPDIEAREQSQLAPFATCAAHSAGRVHSEPEHPLRTAFQRDRDRIVHSAAFRRLQYKTQVFVNHEGDHFRTRLTHTTEVSQIARTIARALACNEDLTEAIALAHDLGHTAFGHSGEDALSEMMLAHGGFEHNRQGVRILDILETPYPSFAGLNLTWEVRRAILKYPSPDHPADQPFLGTGQPVIEAQLVDHADSIAYVHHDLDDGLRAGILDERALAGEVELWSDVAAMVDREHAGLEPSLRRKRIIRALIDLTVTDLLAQTESNLQGIDSPEAVCRAGSKLVAQSPEHASKKKKLLAYLYKHFYHHYLVQRMGIRARHFLRELWKHYVAHPDTLPPKWQSWAAHEGTERAVCDYVAGMTDRMAEDEFARLFLPSN